MMSLDELRDKMAGMMGGRAAEEIFIGEISTGAANDFKQATEIARLMVRDYGMSDVIGPVSLGEERSNVFLRSAAMPEFRIQSERTAQLVDQEIRSLVTEALERARDILKNHREKVEALATRLRAAEVVESEELQRILGPKASPGRASVPADHNGSHGVEESPPA
jgi:cell division protease FtsH